MGSTPGKVSYEFKRGNHEKSVAAEVVVAPDEAVEKSVAEELKIPDPPPVDADKAIADNVVVPEETAEVTVDNTVQTPTEPEEVTEEVVEGEVVKTKKTKKKSTEE